MNRPIVKSLLLAAIVVLGGVGALDAQAAATQTAPGTVTRPILSAAEAAPYTVQAYLASAGSTTAPVVDPWVPSAIVTSAVAPTFIVGATLSVGTATHGTIQEAVNAAVLLGGTDRVYIAVLPGTYTGTVYIPTGSPPITLYGIGAVPSDVQIQLTVSAALSPADYTATVNPAGQYAEGDPAFAMYTSCAAKTTATVGTGCSAVMWVQSADFELTNVTITNTLLDSADSQAVALRTDGDKTHLESVRLIGRQDTAYFSTLNLTIVARVYVKDSYIEGDTDFVFGRATAVFENTEFVVVSSRKPANGVVFAPSTAPEWPYGFLVIHSSIITDAGYLTSPTAHLGRAWDAGAGTTGYIAGTSPNGQLLIRETYIGPGFDVESPWAVAATTARPYAASIAPDRALDDPNFNRMWEYANTGPGTGTEATA